MSSSGSTSSYAAEYSCESVFLCDIEVLSRPKNWRRNICIENIEEKWNEKRLLKVWREFIVRCYGDGVKNIPYILRFSWLTEIAITALQAPPLHNSSKIKNTANNTWRQNNCLHVPGSFTVSKLSYLKVAIQSWQLKGPAGLVPCSWTPHVGPFQRVTK